MKNKTLLTALVVIVLLSAPRIGTLIADKLNPLFTAIDPDKKFMWGIVHHIIQALIPIIVILIWKKNLFKEWGFKWGYKPWGWKWVGWFTLAWTLVYVGITTFNLLTNNTPEAYYDVTNSRNFLGELFFRCFIVGPSEEILFRSFPIVLLLTAGFTKKTDIFGFEITYAGIIAAVLFALAHIGFNFYPFEIYHFSVVQVVTSLGFGLLYAIVFHQTKSIYYPMIIHSISDVIPLLALYILHLLN
ncbi:MAG: CPBP family intramembrane glutamic endopeptidase [Salinivirgaceae bacterium]